MSAPPAAPYVPTSPIGARMLMRAALRNAHRSASVTDQATIDKALTSEGVIDLATASASDYASALPAAAGGILAQLLAWLMDPANFTNLLAMITQLLALFGL